MRFRVTEVTTRCGAKRQTEKSRLHSCVDFLLIITDVSSSQLSC